MNKEREAFEQLEDIAAMMTENPGIEFENGKYVYYGLDGRTAFAVVYISGAWSAWQAKAQAVPELTDRIIVAIESEVESQLKASAIDADPFRLDGEKIWYAALEAQEPNQPTQFNLDEFLAMEEKLKSKGGVIAADLDRFIAYAEMVLEKARAIKEPK